MHLAMTYAARLSRLLKFAELSPIQGKIKRKSGRPHGWGRHGSMDETGRAESVEFQQPARDMHQ